MFLPEFIAVESFGIIGIAAALYVCLKYDQYQRRQRWQRAYATLTHWT